jgi:hypothetical protein
MIRHLFFGKVKAGVPDAEIDRLLTSWNAMPAKIDAIRSITAGRNAGPNQRFTVALVAEFDDWDAWRRYQSHPDHEAIKHDLSDKILEPDERGSIQLEL